LSGPRPSQLWDKDLPKEKKVQKSKKPAPSLISIAKTASADDIKKVVTPVSKGSKSALNPVTVAKNVSDVEIKEEKVSEAKVIDNMRVVTPKKGLARESKYKKALDAFPPANMPVTFHTNPQKDKKKKNGIVSKATDDPRRPPKSRPDKVAREFSEEDRRPAFHNRNPEEVKRNEQERQRRNCDFAT